MNLTTMVVMNKISKSEIISKKLCENKNNYRKVIQPSIR